MSKFWWLKIEGVIFSLFFSLAILLVSFPTQAQTTLLSLNGANFQTKTNGTAIGTTWLLSANGYIESSLNFPTSGTYQFQVQAYGDIAANIWPTMEIRVDQKVIKTISVASHLTSTYSVSTTVSAGRHKIELAFTNDYCCTKRQDRNLYIQHLNVLGAGTPDMIVSSVTMDPTNPTAGQDVTFSAKITNIGSGSTPAGVINGVVFTVDGTSMTWSDNNTSSIAPGTSVIVTANGGPAGIKTWAATAGSHSVDAWVNDANRYAETSSINNHLIAPFSVSSLAPASAPAPTYSISISSPTSGATVSSSIQVKGSASGFLNLEIFDSSGAFLSRTTPSSTGAFSATVDTTKLSNGSQSLTIDAWDSAAGQTFTHTAEAKLAVNVQNAGGITPPASTGSAPMEGPGGYSKMVMNDSFGSSKIGANFTSLSNFNSGAYGASGYGWDDHMCAWDCGKANLSMAADHLELRPTGGKSGFISSRFELLPSGSQRVYYEMRLATGRGATAPQTWPAIWFFAGNEPGSSNAQSEFDIMETYMNQWDSSGNASAGYPYHFAAVVHDNANASSEFKIIETPGIDVTTSYNVYGCEVYKGSNGNLQYNIYFNGKLVYGTSSGLTWRSSAPSLFIGWNPGSTSWSPAVMKLDYVRAWVK